MLYSALAPALLRASGTFGSAAPRLIQARAMIGSSAPSVRRVRVNVNDPQFVDNLVQNTKYNLLNFLPKILLNQFRRPINQYFLVVSLMQLNDRLTPVHPGTTIGPLAFVLTLALIKELVDDQRRRRQDREHNEQLCTLCRRGKLQRIRAADVKVGDVLLIKQDEELPADLVLLKTSDQEGGCYIQTTNLDGEADLKPRRCVPATKDLPDSQISSFQGIIDCAAPSAAVYSFHGTLLLPWAPDLKISLGSEQLLLQSTQLKHTAHAFIAAYGGQWRQHAVKAGQGQHIRRINRCDQHFQQSLAGGRFGGCRFNRGN